MSAPVTTSVVICAYTEDRWDDLRRAVASVAGQTPAPAEIIVVVDHSRTLFERVRAQLVGVRSIENEGRQGLSDARNSGVREASGSIVVFLDDDAEAEPGWLAAMTAPYVRPSVIGVGGSAQPVWLGGGRPGWFPEEFDWVVGCSYRGLPTETSPIRNFLGCNMSFRREAFDVAGGFDTSVGRVGTRPVGGEETEFCIRVRRTLSGAELVYEPSAVVRHTVPPRRATWTYFRARCFAEGLSKAIVGRLAGTDEGLSSERRYATSTLPRGVMSNLLRAIGRRQPDRVLRAAAIIGGLGITTAGYGAGVVLGWVRHRETDAR